MSEYTHEFEMMGSTVRVETNDLGNRLYVTFGDTLIEDSSGECLDWEGIGEHLHGAALEAAEKRILRAAGEASIAEFIRFAREELESE